MINTISAGGVVLNKNKEILVVDQKGRSWSLPKGHVDKGEGYLDAAKREIYEESGIKSLELVRELGSYRRYRISLDNSDDTSEFKTIIMFLFKTDVDILKPIDLENHEARWVKKEEVINLLTHPKDKEFFLSVINELS